MPRKQRRQHLVKYEVESEERNDKSIKSKCEQFDPESMDIENNFGMRWKNQYNTDWSVSEVQRLLDEGADVNEQGWEGCTALHWAAVVRRWDTVQLLLDQGASVDVKTNEGRTALYYAVTAKHTECVKQMLLTGADINVQDKYGDSVLHNAVERDSEPLVELLLKSGADVNCQNNCGGTPLHGIDSIRNSNIVAMLLESGAIVNYKDHDGTTPLHKAAYTRNHEIVEMLLKSGAMVNCVDIYGTTPLHKAAEGHSYKTAEMLLEAGAVVNIENIRGSTPLNLAAVMNNHKLVEILLESGAMVNFKNKEGQTALHHATQSILPNPERSIEALLQAGALLDVKDVYGRAPVSLTRFYNVQAIEYLLLKGARIDEKNKDSILLTPLGRCLISEDGHTELLIKLSSANLLKDRYKINLMDEEIKKKIGTRLAGLKNYEIECVTEVNKMKNHKIGSLRLFSVFSDSADPGFASRADEIQGVLDEAEKQNEYLIYMSLLKSRLKEGVCRRALLDDACDILPRLIPTLNLPEMRRMVLARLSNSDLENIIITFYLNV